MFVVLPTAPNTAYDLRDDDDDVVLCGEGEVTHSEFRPIPSLHRQAVVALSTMLPVPTKKGGGR